MVLSLKWNKKYPDKASVSDFIYNNKERGFIVNIISHIFKPSRIERKDRKKQWKPEMTKQEMWEELFLHVEFMKDLYPKSEGRLCRYCHKPWTYLTRKKQRGTLKPRRRGSQHPTNFSIDRFYSTITYRSGNIVFCCSGCNERKHDSAPDDWKNYLRVLNEKT